MTMPQREIRWNSRGWEAESVTPVIPVENVRPRFTPILSQLVEAMIQIVQSGKYVYGGFTSRWESLLADIWKLDESDKRVIACKSGTDALTFAAWMADLDEGIGANSADDSIEIIVPNLTFPSSATSMTKAGLLRQNIYRVVFADVDPATLNLSPMSVERALTPRTRAIVVPHLYGNPADMKALRQIASVHDLKIIEDISQAHGAAYEGRYVGTLGDTAAGSTYVYKEPGGFGDSGYFVVPSSGYERGLRFRDLGRRMGSRDEFDSEEWGERSRPHELDSAMLCLQLAGLAAAQERRRAIANFYRQELADTPLVALTTEPSAQAVYWRYTVLAPDRRGRDALQAFLAEQRIQTEIVYPFLVSDDGKYQGGQGAYASRLVEGGTPTAAQAVTRLLCLPVWPSLTDVQVNRVVEAVKTFYR